MGNEKSMEDRITNLIGEFFDKVKDAAKDPLCAGFNIDLCLGDAELIIRGLKGLKACTTIQDTREEVFGDTESRSPYAATVEGMLSADYKERFKAEYQQTKIRYEKLKAFCNRIEAAMHTEHLDVNSVEMPKHDCPVGLLLDQQRVMGEYLHYLEIRAVIEGIDLT